MLSLNWLVYLVKFDAGLDKFLDTIANFEINDLPVSKGGSISIDEARNDDTAEKSSIKLFANPMIDI